MDAMDTTKQILQERHNKAMADVVKSDNDRKILDKLNYMLNEIRSLTEKLESPKHVQKTQSDDQKELFAALAKAQGEMPIAGRTSENPYFKSKYADLTELVRVSRPALSKYGLGVTQDLIYKENGQTFLKTVLTHSSGQWRESSVRIVPHKTDIQSYGSFVSYMKRYCYSSKVGVVSSNEDDDGELAVHDMRKTVSKGVALNTKYNPRESGSIETITKEQLEELEYELGDYTDICEMVLEGLKIQSLADMPKAKYMVSVRRIREIKKVREGR